jgi:ribosome-associated protein
MFDQKQAVPEPLEYARIIVDVISDMKGEDIILMDLREITLITDFFVICTADNERQLKAIVDKVTETLEDQHAIPVWRVEGRDSKGWVLLDYEDVVVHIFSEEQREYYDLESLWHNGKILLRMQ